MAIVIENLILDLIEDKTLYTKIDVVSSSLAYVGQSRSIAPPDTEASFSIHRVTVLGNISTIESAKNATYSQVWENRNDGIIFPPPSLENNFSTLFDGAGDHFDFGNAHNFENAKAWSLSMLVRPDNLTQQRCLWSKTTEDANVFGWGWYIDANGKLFLQMRASGQNRAHTFNTTLQAQVWHFIVLTVSGNQNINGCRAYVDKVLQTIPASAPVTATLINNEASRIGRRGSAFHFSGHLDRITFWDKALSQGEVDALYNNRVFISPLSQSFESDLLHFYRCGDGDTVTTLIDNKGAINGALKNFPSVFEDIYKAEVA